ncbi:MAG TPA: hypothetical protein VFI06_13975 [Chitinophagaceae bacterium]|nr:hypothetical protein [Chitinophagaceae bacterium]
MTHSAPLFLFLFNLFQENSVLSKTGKYEKDTRTDKNAWQGWTTETLNNSRITSDEISGSVKRIFRKFKM